ncbi:MAG TPA: M3 family metallopeptidase [Flavobacterium sp.]|nr:M3 family metallopeptidase [Flavobacterium sp.]
MKKSTLILAGALVLTVISCKNETQETQTTMSENPLLVEAFDTPYGVPPFDLIKNEHFEPAMLEGIKQHQAEIEAIADNSEAPTFENTVLAMENSGKLLSRTASIFYNLLSANTNETLQEIAESLAPQLSEHSDNTYLNSKLFARVKSVWDTKESLNLGVEEAKLLEKSYKAFVRSGANLSEADKEKLRKINAELSLLSLKFGNNILAENNNYELVVDRKEDLAGLPEAIVMAAAQTAKDKDKEGTWVFTLQNSSVMPFLQYAENRELRKQILDAYQNRATSGEYDNNENVKKMANLRLEKSNLLGYKNFADYSLEETMAKNPDGVYKLLNQLWVAALDKAKEEEAGIKKMMEADGIKDDVKPYDWRYYTEKIRMAKYNMDEQELAPYLSLANVQNGVFGVTQKLYGLQYEQIEGAPTYHPDATLWKVSEANGDFIGVLYMDFHPRDSKRGGAWMTSYSEQKMIDGKRIPPVISIVCNFTKPVGDTPALLTLDEALTFFHEFGHALHGLLSNVKYESLAGTSVSRDFVELPSQVLENWGSDPAVMKTYAKHYKTGEVIPDALIEKIEEVGTFDQGFATVEYLAASLLDMDYHTQTEPITINVDTFEDISMKKIGLTDAIIPRYRSTYFQHIFAGGYSAGYYSYIWSGVLDTDAFEAFKSTELFNPEKAQAFRKNILERGGTEDAMELYKRFRGAEPSIEPLLRKRGLTPSKSKLKN